MKRFIILLSIVTASAPVYAGPPTEASIEKLLAITKTESLMDGMLSQLEENIRIGMMSATQGKQLTVEQHKLLDVAPAKLAAAIRQDFNWSNLKPVYVQIYRDVLDQSEIDGMIAFYETPAGKATIEKMPAIIQRSTAATQERLKGMLPRISSAMNDALSEAGIK
ncbi:DUF2059 domain-containing protein [Rubrivivax gelatinosus]|uniref:DUF2059 domain-containing protein n=1 Tax=Rubrivivax gelatinosus (strain NBRC 100245 / IL144) TaxID=983917 RepID=I0HKV5_RUBGI|nr:DUF2059 domain-containing protein [Rubrivivax gelatinosus]BAL93642.1 hypothetical protein RGE_02970 [Rubrivivax gelatinosus IL144]